MKTVIFIFGISVILLFLFSLIGIMLELSFNNAILVFVPIFLLMVFLSSIIYETRRYNKKIQNILESHKRSDKKDIQPERDSTTKGRGINISPFRERRSGLTWGGGNVKGANATRGTRKTFLR